MKIIASFFCVAAGFVIFMIALLFGISVYKGLDHYNSAREITVHDSRVEELSKRKVLRDDIPEEIDKGDFIEDREYECENYISFHMNDDELKIVLGILRTGELKYELIDEIPHYRYDIRFYSKGMQMMRLFQDESQECYLLMNKTDEIYKVAGRELEDYLEELLESHRDDYIFNEDPAVAKPVIYLYGYDEPVNVKVDLDENTTFTTTYPKYTSDGWSVKAAPDGHLTDSAGKQYRYLYWEADTKDSFDFSSGFCVKGDETAEFLEETLLKLGLKPDEINEFIIYWLPKMESNPYNVISFQTDNYEKAAKLVVTPNPDEMIRVYMAWYASDELVQDLPVQKIDDRSNVSRHGKVVIEWGGSEVSK